MLYYSSFSIQEQGLKGNWNYELKSVYVIAILDFPIDDKIPEKDVVSHNRLLNVETHEVFYNKLLFVTLEMPYFNKTIDELETNFDKWLYVLKNLHKLEEIPERLRNIIFQKLFSIASYSALNKIEREKYEESLKYYNDLKNSFDTAFEEGKLEAINEIKPILEQKDKELEQKEKELEQERQKAEQERQNLIETAKFLKSINPPIQTSSLYLYPDANPELTNQNIENNSYTSNTSNASICNFMDYYQYKDYENLVQQAAIHQLRTVNQAIRNILNSSYPSMLAGYPNYYYYKIIVKYYIPGTNTPTSSKIINIGY